MSFGNFGISLLGLWLSGVSSHLIDWDWMKRNNSLAHFLGAPRNPVNSMAFQNVQKLWEVCEFLGISRSPGIRRNLWNFVSFPLLGVLNVSRVKTFIDEKVLAASSFSALPQSP